MQLPHTSNDGTPPSSPIGAALSRRLPKKISRLISVRCTPHLESGRTYNYVRNMFCIQSIKLYMCFAYTARGVTESRKRGINLIGGVLYARYGQGYRTCSVDWVSNRIGIDIANERALLVLASIVYLRYAFIPPHCRIVLHT